MVVGNLMSKSKLKYKEFKRVSQKFWIFLKVYMTTHRCIGLLVFKLALQKLFGCLINFEGKTRQNLVP